MARDDDDTESDNYGKHPALRNFSRTGFMAKHVLKSVLKWGAIGAIAGIGAAVAVAAMGLMAGGIWTPIVAVLGGLLSNIPLIGPLITGGAEAVGSMALTGGAYMAGAGGILGAIGGLVMSVSGAGAAADAEEDRLVAKYEQAQARRERLQALERRRDEQRYAMEKQGVAMQNPNMQIPYGRPRQQGQGPAYS